MLVFLVGAAGARETKKLKLLELEIRGNAAFSQGRLKKLMASKASSLFHKRYYDAELLKGDLEVLERFYRNRGWLDMAVEDRDMRLNPEKDGLRVRVYLEEGEPYLLESISCSGNTRFTQEELLSRIQLRAGAPLEEFRVRRSAAALVDPYAEAGFLDAEVKPVTEIDRVRHRVKLVFQVKEGAAYCLGGVKVDGLSITRPWVVRREVRLEDGAPLRYSRLQKAQQDLYGTGLFQRVYVQAVTQGPGGDPLRKDLLVEVREKKRIELAFSAGYGSEDKFRGKVESFNSNLAGTANKVGGSLSVSRLKRRLDGSFSMPWTLGMPWHTDAGLFGEILYQPGYDQRTAGGSLGFGRNLGNQFKVLLAYRHENTSLHHITLATPPELTKTQLRSVALSMALDGRNSFFNPTKGLYVEANAEVSGPFLEGTDSFIKYTGRVKYFRTLRPSTVLAIGLESGWVNSYGGRNPVPLNEKFFAGGANSLRGFGYREAGPRDLNGLPLGGEFMLTANLAELRQRVWKFLGVVGFFDVGNVFPKAHAFNFGELRTSGGWGIRLETPLGILRADQGFIVSPRPDEKKSQIYFSVGQAF